MTLVLAMKNKSKKFTRSLYWFIASLCFFILSFPCGVFIAEKYGNNGWQKAEIFLFFCFVTLTISFILSIVSSIQGIKVPKEEFGICLIWLIPVSIVQFIYVLMVGFLILAGI